MAFFADGEYAPVDPRAGPAGLGPDGTLTFTGPITGGVWTDRTWGGRKVLWEVDPTVPGSVLVRARQLDGAHPVGFDDPVTTELVLQPKDPSTPGGWRDYPGYTRLRAPGCYGYQVDTVAGTSVVIFRAVGPNITG